MDRKSKPKRTKWGRYTAEVTREEIERCFHMRAEDACKELRIGLTILKRLCRRFGIGRWPYRKLKHEGKLLSSGNPTASTPPAPRGLIEEDEDDDESDSQAEGGTPTLSSAPSAVMLAAAKPAALAPPPARTPALAPPSAPRPQRKCKRKRRLAEEFCWDSSGSEAEASYATKPGANRGTPAAARRGAASRPPQPQSPSLHNAVRQPDSPPQPVALGSRGAEELGKPAPPGMAAVAGLPLQNPPVQASSFLDAYGLSQPSTWVEANRALIIAALHAQQSQQRAVAFLQRAQTSQPPGAAAIAAAAAPPQPPGLSLMPADVWLREMLGTPPPRATPQQRIEILPDTAAVLQALHAAEQPMAGQAAGVGALMTATPAPLPVRHELDGPLDLALRQAAAASQQYRQQEDRAPSPLLGQDARGSAGPSCGVPTVISDPGEGLTRHEPPTNVALPSPGSHSGASQGTGLAGGEMAGKAGGPREHDGGVDSFAPDMVVARSAAELQRAFMHADGGGGMPTAPGMLPQATPAALLQHLRRQYGGGVPRQMFGGAGGLPRSAVSHSMPGHGVALYEDNLFNLSPSAPFLGDDLATALEAPDGLEPSTVADLLFEFLDPSPEELANLGLPHGHVQQPGYGRGMSPHFGEDLSRQLPQGGRHRLHHGDAGRAADLSALGPMHMDRRGSGPLSWQQGSSILGGQPTSSGTQQSMAAGILQLWHNSSEAQGR